MDKFYEAILDDPENDTLRLVYADWLDDEGRYDEAELIRVQIQLENQPSSPGSLFHKEHMLIQETKIKHPYKGLRGYCSVDSLFELEHELNAYPIRGVTMHFFPRNSIPMKWQFVKEVNFYSRSGELDRFTNQEIKWLRNKTKLLLPYIHAPEQYISSLCRQLKSTGLTSLGFNYYVENDEHNYDDIIQNNGLEVLDCTSWIPLS